MTQQSKQQRRTAPWVWAAAALGVISASAVLGWQQWHAPAVNRIDATDPQLLAQGQAIYVRQCASCHGAQLEGQPDWRSRLPSGRLPAPPHDATGHTWHHPGQTLFEIVRDGVAKHAPAGYESDMPAFGSTLSDTEIWAVLAYIRSTWPADVQRRHAAMDRSARSAQ